MFGNYDTFIVRNIAWTLHKVFKSIYEYISVEESSLNKLRNNDKKKNGPLIIIPTHRSYMDFLLVSYIFFSARI